MESIGGCYQFLILWLLVTFRSTLYVHSHFGDNEDEDVYRFQSNFSIAPHHQQNLNDDVSEAGDKLLTLSAFNEAMFPFASQECLIHVTSFGRQVFDFQEAPLFPLILRHLSAHKIVYYIIYRDRHSEFVESVTDTIWIMKGVNISFRNVSTAYCFYSLYINIGNRISICAKLDKFKFSAKSKPWRCEAHLGIFPPTTSLRTGEVYNNHLNYPAVWYYDSTISRFVLPGNTLKYNMIVVSSKMHRLHLQRDLYRNWARLYFGLTYDEGQKHLINLSQLATDIFLIFQTRTSSRRLLPTKEQIISIWNIKVCQNCATDTKNLSQLLLQEIRLQHWLNFTSIRDYFYKEFYKEDDETRWILHSRGSTINSANHFEYFQTCKRYHKNKPTFASSGIDLQMASIVHIWHLIMKNYTYRSTFGNWWEENECWSGSSVARKTNKFIRYSSSTLHLRLRLSVEVPDLPFTIIFPNDVATLRFVSCGRPKTGAFAFSALLSVFEWPVWLACLVIVAASILFKIVCFSVKQKICANTVLTYAFEYFKNFVEQGSSLLNTSVSHKWTIFMGLYMPVHIVLSNAYRNSNVYNMVQPREPIPYERLSQLINDNFKIYSRNVGRLTELLEHWSYDYEPLNVTKFTSDDPHDFMVYSGDHYLGSVWSEIRMIEMSRMKQLGMESYTNEEITLLKNHSGLHPDMLSICNQTAHEH